MISHLQGSVILINVSDGTISVLVNGVGYLVAVGSKASSFVQVGSQVSLFIEAITKETGTSLYGFGDYEKLIWFKSLLKVSGVGPKVAMNVIDSISTGDLTRAIVNEQVEILRSVGGLGEKVASRIVAELKKEPAKNAKILGATRVFNGQMSQMVEVRSEVEVVQEYDVDRNEVISALMNLGFDYNRSFAVVCDILPNVSTLEDAIKEALKKINS